LTGTTGVMHAPEFHGAVAGPPAAGGVAVSEVAPARVLPPALDLADRPLLTVTVRIDAAAPKLGDLIDTAGTLPCLWLDLPGGDGYRYVDYALRDVDIATFDPVANGGRTPVYATVNLAYSGASWRYAPPNGPELTGDSDTEVGPTEVVTGTSELPWVVAGTAGGLIFLGGVWMMRRARRR
jgi:hypothetical protein